MEQEREQLYMPAAIYPTSRPDLAVYLVALANTNPHKHSSLETQAPQLLIKVPQNGDPFLYKADVGEKITTEPPKYTASDALSAYILFSSQDPSNAVLEAIYSTKKPEKNIEMGIEYKTDPSPDELNFQLEKEPKPKYRVGSTQLPREFFEKLGLTPITTTNTNKDYSFTATPPQLEQNEEPRKSLESVQERPNLEGKIMLNLEPQVETQNQAPSLTRVLYQGTDAQNSWGVSPSVFYGSHGPYIYRDLALYQAGMRRGSYHRGGQSGYYH